MHVVYRNHLDRLIARVVHVLCANMLFNYLPQQNFECNDHKKPFQNYYYLVVYAFLCF